jgi:RNA polymerase sigma-70 factor, ECF subfamily
VTSPAEQRPADESDRALLTRVAGGDALACRELLGRYGQRLYRIVLASHRDPDLAEDIVQETFIRAVRAAATLREETSLFAWLAQIAHRVAIDFYRKNKRLVREVVDTADARPRPDADLEASEAAGRVRLALARLKPDVREVVVLRYYGGFSVAELARVLGKSEVAVRKELQRARERLRKLLGTAFTEEEDR